MIASPSPDETLSEPQSSSSSPPGTPSGRRHESGSPRLDLAALLLLAALAAAPYWRIVAPEPLRAWFVDGDFVDQFFAFARFETARFAAGELPLWNPYAYAGSPFWADIQAAVAYPPSLIVVLLSAFTLGRLPFLALEVEAVAHIILGAWFTYLFARRVFGRRDGALVAGLAFGLGGWANGYAPLQLAVLQSGVWLPLALWGIDRWIADSADTDSANAPAPRHRALLDSPGPLALGTALGLAVLAGHPQTVLHMLYATAAWSAWRAWPRTAGSERAASPTSPTESSTFRQLAPEAVATPSSLALVRPSLVLGLLAAAGLGALISAAGWLPAAEFLRASNRADAPYAMLAHGFPPRELLGVAIPGLTLWSPLYIGLLPLLLAAGAARRALFGGGEGPGGAGTAEHFGRHDPFWIGLALVGLLLSLGGGGPLFDLAYHVAPGFDLFRGQERAAFPVSFTLAMLAGSGAAAWRRGADDIGRSVLVGATGIVALGAMLAFVATPDARPAVWRLLAVGGATAALAGAGLGLFAESAFQYPASRRARGRMDRAEPAKGIEKRSKGGLRAPGRPWLAMAIALAAADLIATTSGTNLVDHPPRSLAAPPLIELVASPGVQRVLDEDRYPRNTGVLHGFESASGASPLRLTAFQTLRDGLADIAPERLRSLLAVSHVITWRESLDGAIVLEIDARGDDESTTLFELSPVAPYAWRAITAEVVPDDGAAIARLLDPAFEPLTTVLLHDADSADAGGPHGATGITDVRERAPGRVRVRTEAAAPGWIVFSEMHAPGWRATVDGRSATVHRADVALMAVAVPPGDHEVELRYRPRSIPIGLTLSALGALIALAWSAGVIRRGRSRERFLYH